MATRRSVVLRAVPTMTRRACCHTCEWVAESCWVARVATTAVAIRRKACCIVRDGRVIVAASVMEEERTDRQNGTSLVAVMVEAHLFVTITTGTIRIYREYLWNSAEYSLRHVGDMRRVPCLTHNGFLSGLQRKLAPSPGAGTIGVEQYVNRIQCRERLPSVNAGAWPGLFSGRGLSRRLAASDIGWLR